MRASGWVLIAVVGGCAPLSPTPPFLRYGVGGGHELRGELALIGRGGDTLRGSI